MQILVFMKNCRENGGKTVTDEDQHGETRFVRTNLCMNYKI